MADTIKIDTRQLIALEKRLAAAAKAGVDMSKPFKLTRTGILADIGMRFRQGGPNDLGSKWAPLAPATIARKRKGPHPERANEILVETGYMRKSIGWESGRDFVRIFPGVDYAVYHHPPDITGHPSRGIMPNRAFMFVDNRRFDRIIGYFSEFIDGVTDKIAGH